MVTREIGSSLQYGIDTIVSLWCKNLESLDSGQLGRTRFMDEKVLHVLGPLCPTNAASNEHFCLDRNCLGPN